MNLYAQDLSLLDFDFGFSDPITEPFSHHHRSYNDDDDDDGHHHRFNYSDTSNYDYSNSIKGLVANRESPPKHRHDGKSALPLGMDWSAPPRKWDGRDSVWPHDPQTGWSYCITIPSWILLPKSRGSDPIVFYRVQVGIQSPKGITTTRGILRRFSDFLELLSELKKEFPKKSLPPTPPKKILRMKSRTLLEERRCSLEDWMAKLLSDIDISRSAPVATFLELEAAARSSFNDVDQEISDANSSFGGMIPSFLLQTNSDVSMIAGSSSIASDHGSDSPDEISELGKPRRGKDNSADLVAENSVSEQNLTNQYETNPKYRMFNRNFILENLERFSGHKMHTGKESTITGREKVTENETNTLHRDRTELFPEAECQRLDGHVRRLSTESIRSDLSSARASEVSNWGVFNLFSDGLLDLPEGAEAPEPLDAPVNADFQLPRDLLVALPSDERNRLNRVLKTLQQRLAMAKTDMEDLISRLNQEVAVRQFLTTKVKDLEVELETTRENCKQNMQQAVLIEKERFTHTQWDMEELRKQCLEMELTLKSVQDGKARIESAKISLLQENKMLLQDLDVAREQLENLHKHHEELELKSKADVKILVKEVKSLRSSQSELKQELSRMMKEKLEVERVLQKEKQRREHANTANAKLLHECEILWNRLQECSVNFLIEEEDKLIVDTSSPSDAIDLLTTSDNRIGLLLAEAQLLAQDAENLLARLDETRNINDSDRKTDDELRKMLTDILVDNAKLKKQMNSVLRCTLNTHVKSDQEDEEDENPLRKTVLSKFLER